jgi:tripartite-type tricarboxylate transporter receptor subunit TctC
VPALTDLLGGQVQVMFDLMSTSMGTSRPAGCGPSA